MGNISKLLAKMTGMTPAWLTRSGRNCRVPPKTRRPRTCLADCVGMRRWPLVMAITPTTTRDEQDDQHDQLFEARCRRRRRRPA